MNTIKRLLPFLFIILIGSVIYSNTFDVPFQFDGKEYIAKNPFIRSIEGLKATWAKGASHQARIITHISFYLNYKAHQLDLFGYHLTNLIVHLTNAFLVLWLVNLTFLTPQLKDKEFSKHRPGVALFTALLFLTHPIQTQAITYIAQRFASLAALFYLLSLCLYIKGRVGGNKLLFLGSFFFAFVGMFTKQTVFTLPFIILLYEFTFLKSEDTKISTKTLIPLFAFILIIPGLYSFKAIRLLSQTALSDSHRGDLLTAGTYLLTQFRVIATYIRLLFFPIGQNLDYDFPMSHSLFEAPTLLAFVFLLSIIALAVKIFPKHRLLSFGIFWFFLTLAIESSVIVLENVIFEHRVYLPLVGFCLAVSAGMFLLIKNTRICLVALTIIIAGLSVLTFERNKVWQDEFALWEDAAKKSPDKARPYKNLGIAYVDVGNFVDALKYFKKASRLDPDDPDVFNNMGNIYNRQGDKQRAITLYEKVIGTHPNHKGVYNNLGSALYDLGRYEEALRHYKTARKLYGLDPNVYYNLANVYYIMGNKKEALKMNQKALQLAPDFIGAYQNLGVLYSDMGKS